MTVPYLMENPDEADRLEAKTDVVMAERLLRLTGLAPGMAALDAGAGSGAVARIMSRIVGEAGRVVALDRSSDRLSFGRLRARGASLTNVEFAEGDLEAHAPARGPYDFVWCRFVFEYMQEPDRALAHLIEATRVGGKVVVADLDGNALFHYPMSEAVERGLARIVPALRGRFDAHAGLKLYHRFKRASLADVHVHVEPYHVYAGAASAAHIANWEQKLRTIRPLAEQAMGGPGLYEIWAAEFIDMLRDPAVFTYSTLIVVEGVRER
jgi:ubiquinone/menaquinone biosynthesis C-methylase UbiE